MNTSVYNLRLDKELQKDAFAVFKSYGLTPAQAIRMFLKQTAETKTIPLDLSYQPNQETRQAMQELEQTPSVSYKTVEAAMSALHEDS